MKKAAAFLYKHPFYIFLLFLGVAYLPVLLPYFHLKNDLISQNLPTRFVFSEALYSGYEPFWNPYLHYGSPQYGDMNNGFWNPMQWLIGSTIGYSIYSITFEELFYILIGGWGMYKVTKEFFNKDVAILTGLTYMCCGYLTGHLQYFCWMTGTGYFPYVLLFFIRINKNPILKNFLLGGICVFLFTASTHPGLIIGAAYFFVFALLMIYYNRKGILKELYHPKFWVLNLLFIVISTVLTIVVIYSNVEVLQYIYRGSKVSLEQTLMTPTSLQSYLSLYFPLAVNKSGFFNTDIAMRNVYIGIAHLAGIIYIVRILSKRVLISMGIPLLFFVLLSAGSFFKVFAWKYLPLLGFVRLNGEFNYFVILFLLLYGSAGIHQLLQDKSQWKERTLKTLSYGTILVTILAVLLLFISGNSIFFHSGYFSTFKQSVKSIIDNSSIWDLLFFQAIIQLCTLYFLRKKLNSRKALSFILCLNLAVITWCALPFTGLGMMSKKEVQTIISRFPKGIRPQELVAINDASYITPPDESQFQLIASYSKKIGSIQPDQYPVQLSTNDAFIGDKELYSFIKQQSFLFLCDDTVIHTRTSFDSTLIEVEASGPGYFRCRINNNDFKWLILLQNNYKYWEVRVDQKPISHFTAFKTFIAVPFDKGRHEVEFRFDAGKIKKLAWINIALLLLALTMAFYPITGNRRLFK